MSTVDELRRTASRLNSIANAKYDAALAASDDAARLALLDEGDRINDQAKKITKLMLEAQEGRLARVVTVLEDIVAEERRRASDIVARVSDLLDLVGGGARVAPLPGSSSVPAPGPGPLPGGGGNGGAEVATRAVQPAAAPSGAPTPPPGGTAPPAPTSPPVDPNRRDTDLTKLHPAVRVKVEKVIADLAAASVPMKVFEAYRAPVRQRMLFNKGRSGGVIVDRSKVVTFADAWKSYHQYGLAVDMVIDNPPMNMWETSGIAGTWWDKYHEIARKQGLEPLSFEKPHIQLEGTRSSALLAGEYPDGGDSSWAEALDDAIARWPESNKPPSPIGNDRQAIGLSAAAGASTSGVDWAALPAVIDSPMTSRFGGRSWRVDGRGVFLADDPGTPQRTPGTPLTVGRNVELYGREIAAAASKYGIAPELLIMTIATETAIFRRDNFTGPSTFRWEAHFEVGSTGDPTVDGKEKGDYSAGPMQVMADTARWLNTIESFGYTNATDFKYFRTKPNTAARANLGFYDASTCIDTGACYIRRQLDKTAGNPILLAAGYNAGSVRSSGTSIWGIHAHSDHLDRAARWFGDACEVLAALGR